MFIDSKSGYWAQPTPNGRGDETGPVAWGSETANGDGFEVDAFERRTAAKGALNTEEYAQALSATGGIGEWMSRDGSHNSGVGLDAALYRGNKEVGDIAEPLGMGGDLVLGQLQGGVLDNVSEDGSKATLSAGLQATAAQAAATFGNENNSVRVGAGLGAGAGLRLHTKDVDGDGDRDFNGLGIDYMFGTLDVKSDYLSKIANFLGD